MTVCTPNLDLQRQLLPAARHAQAARVRITVGVTLRAVGTPGRPGYQPQSRTQVVSDVSLRNRLLTQ